jgi:hypothetical protein
MKGMIKDWKNSRICYRLGGICIGAERGRYIQVFQHYIRSIHLVETITSFE